MEMTTKPSTQPNATNPTKGTIKSIDTAAHTVTLDSGKVCNCTHAVDLAKFKSGDKVDMTFVEKNGKSVCCAMTAAA